MATVLWVGNAQATPDLYTITVGASPVAGTSYGFDANGRSVRFKATTTSQADTAAGIVAAWSASTDARLRELTVQVNPDDATKIDVYGYPDGRDITSFATTGGIISSAHTTTGTGPNYADNVLNYSTGALPSGGDTLLFDGLTTGAGPMYALNALSAITLALLDVRPTYQGRIGLPDQSVSGYTEFRTKYFQVKSAAHRILSNGPDTDGRFRINGGAVVSAIVVSGSGAQQNVYAVHLYNFPTGSGLQPSNIGVASALENGQTAVFDASGVGVTATNGAVVNLSSRTTVGGLIIDGSSAFIDCTFATLDVRNASNVLAGPNANCSTATGIAVTVDGGTLDWRSASKPSAQPSIGTGATLITKNAVGTIPVLTALWRYEGSTFDDSTGRVTYGYPMKYSRCSPQSCTTLLPENVTLTTSAGP